MADHLLHTSRGGQCGISKLDRAPSRVLHDWRVTPILQFPGRELLVHNCFLRLDFRLMLLFASIHG